MGLPIVLLLLLLLAGALVGLVALVVNRRTRPFGLAILFVGEGLLALLLLVVAHRPSAPMPMASFSASVDPATPGAVAPPPLETIPPNSPLPPGEALEVKGEKGVNGVKGETGVKGEKAAQPTRPAWVDEPPQYVNNAYLMPVTVGPYTTGLECEAKVPAALETALGDYIDLYLGPAATRRVRLPDSGYELRRQFVRQEWVETVQTSVGRMVVLHLQLALDRKIQDRIRDALRESMVAERLRLAAFGFCGVMAFLGAVFGYLKFTGRRR
jgi:hypothetical protein